MPIARVLAALGLLALTAAVLIDLVGARVAPSEGWPRVSHALIAAGLAAGLLAVLMRTLATPRGARRAARATLLELVAFGLLLGAWRLRGHPEIPPDPPLVAAAVLALLLLVLSAAWRARLLRSG